MEKDKILNPKTRRMVMRTSALGKKILKEMNDFLKETKKKKKEVKPKIKEGYEIINGKLYKICKEGQVRNPKTNRCIKEVKKEVKKKPIKRFTTYMKYPLNHEFNKKNVKKFLEECDYKTKPLAKKIIDNTMHVSFEKMIKYLNMNVKDMINSIKKERPIFIYINLNEKQKSNYWIYLYLKDYIKFKYPNRKVIILSNKILDDPRLKDDDTIVFIDDCIYTGLQMSNNIRMLNNINNHKLNIFILASFISIYGQEFLSSIKDYKIIFNSHLVFIPTINDFLTDNELEILSSYYTNTIYDHIFEYFPYKHLIYFDHKLADNVSTIPLFYSGIVPNTYNKELFNNNDIIDIPDDLEIIPLFKNCENVRNTNEITPECPSTPYKILSNEQFMKKLERQKKQLSDTKIKNNKIKKERNNKGISI
jgi:hypothetical protein